MSDARVRTWCWAGVVGPLAFGLAALVGGTLVDGYSHRTRFVSELAARGSDARPLMTAGFLVYGAGLVVLAWCLRRRWVAATALAVLVGLSGLGTFVAGVGSCDAGCPTDGARSFSQQVHDAASVPTFLLWAAVAILAAWRYRGTRYGTVSAVLAAVQLAAIPVLGAMSQADGNPPDGLVQRIDLVAAGLWVAVTALAVRSHDEPARRRAQPVAPPA